MLNILVYLQENKKHEKIFILSFVTLTSFAAFAQSGSNIKFGVKAGVTLPTFAVSGDGEDLLTRTSTTSLFFGGNADFAISPMFSIQPGLSLIRKGSKIELDLLGLETTFTTNIMYVEVPVNLLANFKVGSGKIFIGAGPYFGFAISGKVKAEATLMGEPESVEETLKISSSDDSDIKSTEFRS